MPIDVLSDPATLSLVSYGRPGADIRPVAQRMKLRNNIADSIACEMS